MRLLLLIMGIVFGGYVLYLAYKRRAKKTHFQSFDEKAINGYHQAELVADDPLLEHRELPQEMSPEVVPDEPQIAEVATPAAPANRVEFIALTILPKQQSNFSGLIFSAILKKLKFFYGKHRLFHYHQNEAHENPILFSVASLAEPGFFEKENLSGFNVPGMMLFMRLPCAADPIETFEKMLDIARQLSTYLNADLCDTDRTPLTTDTIEAFREAIVQLNVERFG